MANSEKPSNEIWKKFLRRHWKASVLIGAGSIGAVIAAILVFLWVVSDAQSTGLVPAVLGQWTVGIAVTFILSMIFWELLFVGSWAIPIALIIYFQWYKKLPEKEQAECKGKHKSSGDSFSFFAGLIWLAIVWFYGLWDLAFQAWTFNDWVYSWLAAYLLLFLIIGIPGTIYVIYSLRKK